MIISLQPSKELQWQIGIKRSQGEVLSARIYVIPSRDPSLAHVGECIKQKPILVSMAKFLMKTETRRPRKLCHGFRWRFDLIMYTLFDRRFTNLFQRGTYGPDSVD